MDIFSYDMITCNAVHTNEQSHFILETNISITNMLLNNQVCCDSFDREYRKDLWEVEKRPTATSWK